MKKILLLMPLLFLASCGKKTVEPSPVNKLAKHMNFKEAAQAIRYYKETENSDCFINCAERLLAVGGDQDIEQTTRLDLAEHFLKESKYEKCANYAQEYIKLYPGTLEAKRVAFVEIMAYYRATLTSDRDQSDTIKALEHSQEFLKAYPDDTEYKQEIENIIQDCYKKLIESEFHVLESYINKYNYYNYTGPLDSAKKRLQYIKEKLLPNYTREDINFAEELNDFEKFIDSELEKFKK